MTIGDRTEVSQLLERIALVTLFACAAGLVSLLFFMLPMQVPQPALKYAAIAAVGLTAGYSTRRLLVTRTFYLRLLVSLFALIVALVVLNIASRGYIGLNLLQLYPSTPVWDGGLSLLVAGAAAWLALRAWTGPVRTVLVEPRSESAPVIAPPAAQPASGRVRTGVRRPSRTPRVSGSSLAASFNTWRERTAARLSHLLPDGGGTGTATRRRKAARKPAKRKTQPARPSLRSPEVQLLAGEKHICPYCLEEVVKNDRRGVKICKVCKTWHHGDCWAITGVCQVPHQYVN